MGFEVCLRLRGVLIGVRLYKEKRIAEYDIYQQQVSTNCIVFLLFLQMKLSSVADKTFGGLRKKNLTEVQVCFMELFVPQYEQLRFACLFVGLLVCTRLLSCSPARLPVCLFVVVFGGLFVCLFALVTSSIIFFRNVVCAWHFSSLVVLLSFS